MPYFKFVTFMCKKLVINCLKNLPDMPCLQELYKKQKGIVELAIIQKRKAFAVCWVKACQLQINRWSTGHFIPPAVYIRLFCLCFRKHAQDNCS
jgi:hypothetical protein